MAIISDRGCFMCWSELCHIHWPHASFPNLFSRPDLHPISTYAPGFLISRHTRAHILWLAGR
jgi:hypothetical protein